MIEDLDSNQVDPELAGFGQHVVDSLHRIVSVLDRAQKRSDLRESTSYAGRRRYGRYGTYGYFEQQDSLRDRQAIQAEEASRGLESAHTIVEELRSLSAQTRQTMTERYNLSF
ncbi:hypothetical protein [Adhaeretor mobilis]|uniref:hypothetical protein n=1 Tax=Adhaeretor mobilis TaxID=1930276 RepID=UPI0011A78A3B|nr:hypothetical protein [Adhaeretor mobilis]